MIANENKLNYCHLRIVSFASSFEEASTFASGASGSSLQSSLQSQVLLQTTCKENHFDYHLFTKFPFANPFAENTNLKRA